MTHQRDTDTPAALAPSPREEAITAGGYSTGRDIYRALMNGLAEREQNGLEEMMIDNIERLRSDGDSYAP